MKFIGIDPGSNTFAIAEVSELGILLSYKEVPTSLIPHYAFSLVREIVRTRPLLIAVPSGHGLPFYKVNKITEREIFLLSLADPKKEGPLRNFLRSSMWLNNAFVLPSVIELDSVPIYRKINVIDMGTADKVASAFFYRTLYDSFVLVEVGSNFSAVIIVVNGRIIDGFGGTIIPGPTSAGFIDGEVAYLLHKYAKITKDVIYSSGNWEKGKELIRMIAEWYSTKFDIPIIVSGKRKYELDFGKKFEFKFKEAAVGSAYIANAVGGGIYRKYLDMLKSSNTAISYVRLKGWEEIISLIKT
ncbi:DUF1464 family protein [Sulfurisphaera ohwakuensis]|uniref:DUF1464 domain-containing protein n=1 Tax=Sulfurisphaera ohwakuensis TaxID=69656 RepID=A0A650CDN9_SULOH|nr:DUF1464 family protein [Sulfurisphaera ohwakuensis]MBB5253201.1 putative butyrate kinase (DUF1464 family) [Sulfurisphaera ohwakuensis]QGR15889.1 DUF1464 domain-containing protein [Sulfurisphaera ohwakuensis]